VKRNKQTKLDLSPEEQKEVFERSTPRAAVVYEAILEEGEHEIKRPNSALAWSGLAAGLSMGFSLVAEGLLRAYVPDTNWSILLYKFGYSAGFLIVVLGRQQLFTENTLTVILPLLQELNFKTLRNVFRVWVIVFLANLVGNFAFAWVIDNANMFKPEVYSAFKDIVINTISVTSWGTTLIRGIFAAWIIAMMVWLLPAAESARMWIIIIMTYLVALGNFIHVIAGSVEVFYALNAGLTTWGFYIFQWLLPALLGNIIGGVSLVAVLGHVQVINEKKEKI
jgi:formate/nitrite transporter FocA (FNT family)